MPAQLVALGDGPSILLDKPILLIGRHPECDIQIESRKVSRRHCCIAQVSDFLIVRDLASTNGVRINGVRINEGRLKDGDELTIGNFRYRVSWDSPSGGSRSRSQTPPAAIADESADQAPGMPRQTVRSPLPANEVGDDLLEEADEPIPLAEPESPLPSKRPTPRDVVPPLPSPLVAPAAKEPPRSPPPPPPEESLILPDHLELLPGSDLFPKAADSHPFA